MALAKEILVGARLAAGFMVAADAADGMGLPRNVILRAEAGVTTFLPKHFERAATLYGVSEGFLADGVVESKVDELAARLAKTLAEVLSPDVDANGIARLKEMRLAAGFSSATSAANAIGWAVPSYASHESGKRPVSVERIIGYALGFGFRPEFAVLGTGDMTAVGFEEVDWWTNQRLAEVRDRPAVAWSWLNKAKESRRQTFPVVEYSRGKFELLNELVTLPAWFLPAGTMQNPLYGVKDTSSKNPRIIVVDPNRFDETVVRTERKALRVSTSDNKDKSYVPKNPLSPNAYDEIVLGKVMYILEMHAVADH